MPELESLSWLSNTQVVFALIAVGTVLLLIEVASPGGWFAGIAGVGLIGLAGLALLSLPFSWVGLGLIAIGLALFLFEFTGGSDYGVFGAAGVISFTIGGLLLFDDRTALGFLAFGATVAFMCACLAGLWHFARKAKSIHSPSKDSQMVGQVGTVRADLNPTGTVQVANELWTAESDSGEPIQSGELVMVTEVEGLTLKVFRDPLSSNP